MPGAETMRVQLGLGYVQEVSVCRSVLVVEDGGDERHYVVSLVEGGGHDVRQASDAHEALRLFRLSRPNVMVLDMALPGIDGFELLRRLKGELGDCRVIAVSARVLGNMTEELCLRAGCFAFMQKPFSPPRLLKLIAEA
jgi:two-component system CheB/CheR fusion protein